MTRSLKRRGRASTAVAAAATREILGELPAREAAELPVALRRRRHLAAQRRESFREMLEAGRAGR
jgi:hypothetical protein